MQQERYASSATANVYNTQAVIFRFPTPFTASKIGLYQVCCMDSIRLCLWPKTISNRQQIAR